MRDAYEYVLSVIVPVYNTAQYLRRFLDSIAPQLTEQCELILVDDGSTDESGNLCDEYAANHINTIVIHQKNAGVSAARNAGIGTAHGQWLWFCDSDDRIMHDAIPMILATLKSESPGLIVFPVIEEDERKRQVGLITAPEGEEYGRRGPLQSGDSLYPFTHVLSRELVGDERFDTRLTLCEDRDFLYRVCMKVRGDATIINKPLYAYLVTRQDSAVHSLPVFSYVKANDVEYRILQNELKCGRPEPAYTIFIDRSLGVLNLIAKTGLHKERFTLLRRRMLFYDRYSKHLKGKAALKYRVCKDMPHVYTAVYAVIGIFAQRKCKMNRTAHADARGVLYAGEIEKRKIGRRNPSRRKACK